MGVLILGQNEEAAIATAIERARNKVIPWSVMKDSVVDDRDHPTGTLTLEERGQTQRPPSEHLMLGTYHAALSFEEQPAGILRHLSVSSRDKGKIPNLEVMRMVAKAFGFSDFPPERPGRIWNEEYERGQFAVNIVELEPESSTDG